MKLTVLHAGRHLDVVAAVTDDHTVAELVAAIAAWLDVASTGLSAVCARTGRTLPCDHPVGKVDLLSGDQLILCPAAPPGVDEDARRAPAAVLDVIAGPDAGASIELVEGIHLIGRHRHAEVVLIDARVARWHAELTVAANRCTIAPYGSDRPVSVNGCRIWLPMTLDDDDVVVIGATTLAVRAIGAEPVARPTCGLGQVEFRRTPYRPPAPLGDRAITCAAPPNPPERRRFQAWVAITPLAGGLLMYAFSRQVQFLALTLISPVAVLAGVIDDRRSGRRRHAEQIVEFERRVSRWRDEIELARRRQQVADLRASPDVAQLARRAERRAIQLWERGVGDPDFLQLRLGTGSAPAHFRIVLEPGGDDDRRQWARRTVAGLDRVEAVPVVADLVGHRVIALHGPVAVVGGVAASLIAQAVCLHSPEQLVLAALIDTSVDLSWLKWLPHVSSPRSPMRGPHVVDRPDEVEAAVRSLIETAESRARAAPACDGVPHLLAVIDGSACGDAALVQRLLDAIAGTAVGISVIWIAASAAAVTRHASAVLSVDDADATGSPIGRWWSTDPSTPAVGVDLEPIGGDAGERVGRALAPIADASARASAIPGDVSLYDVLGVQVADREWIVRQWRGDEHQRLRFPVGRNADGVVELDLVEHGPHTLIGGTSGSGKSELLQTLVVGLAASHPPDRLQFLFVDYKGGASTRVVEGLPHTVGCVTNLDAGLARRAMVSLRAELQHRMAILDGVAKDVDELRARHPERAPASLVIVVDELATLVKEIPEFVDGLVDIAQRGRSLGIHLVLATQRPSGSVSESILANTNLRIALRVLDAAESSLIVGNDAAARIPAWRRGGAVVRHGELQTTDLQTAYGGGLAEPLAGRPAVSVADFDRAHDRPRRDTTLAGAFPGTTQIEALVGAITAAANALALPAPRRPWCPPLPQELSTSALPGPQWPQIVFGLVDAPEHQRQHPATLDLSSGVALVFGGSGSGRTTLLTTVAHQLSTIHDVEMVVIDAGSPRLACLAELTGVVAVASADDLEAVTRLLVTLEAELANRRADRNRRWPPIVLLVDGWPALMSALAVDSWSERLVRVVTEGRQFGMAVVITSDRAGAIAPAVHAATGHRLVLRHPDPSRYLEHGVTAETLRHLDLRPGRGLFDGKLVQIARADATAGRRRRRTNTLTSRRLPTRIDLVDVAAADRRPLQVVVGVADVTGAPVAVDLEWSDVVVIGSARSGRSTALATIAAGLGDGHEVFVVSDSEVDADVLQCLVDGDRSRPPGRPRVLLVDDLGSLDQPGTTALWTSISQTRHLRIVAARSVATTPGYHPLLARLRAARQLVFLQPDDPAQFMANTGLRRSLRPGLDTPPGRAIVVADRQQTTVQIAVSSETSVARASGFAPRSAGYRGRTSRPCSGRQGGKTHEW